MIYIYSNETGLQVGQAISLEQAENDWNTNDFHFSDCDVAISNAISLD